MISDAVEHTRSNWAKGTKHRQCVMLMTWALGGIKAEGREHPISALPIVK